MLFLTRPTRARIAEFIAAESEREFSYASVGATQSGPPAGYVTDHNRVHLGRGLSCFDRARVALSRWKMFDIGWADLCWPDSPIQSGTTVAVLARVLRIWSLNACRIVYEIDEHGTVERFGFAYGTLPDHAESGEECFSVEWNRSDDSVSYDILAFSRPHQWAAKAALPYTRSLQKRFARDSLLAMQRALSTNAD